MKNLYVLYKVLGPNHCEISVKDLERKTVLDTQDAPTEILIRYVQTHNISTVIIQNWGMFYIHSPLPVYLRDKKFLSLFQHAVVDSITEAPVKILSPSHRYNFIQKPVFEHLLSLKQEFPWQTLRYFDSDLSTDETFKQWLRFMRFSKPPFEANFVGFDTFANQMMLEFEYSIDDWKQIKKSQTRSNKLFWSYNRHKRWGKVLIIYLLNQAGLLPDGIVSLHIPTVRKTFIDLCNYYNVDIEQHQLDQFNSCLPIVADQGIDSHGPTAHQVLPKPINLDILGVPINVCTETFFFEKNLFFTEKLLKPLLCGQVILPVAGHGVLHAATSKFGYKFSPVSYTIDSIQDPIDRANAVVEHLIKFKNNEELLANELLEVEKNYDHNLELLYNYKNVGYLNWLSQILKD